VPVAGDVNADGKVNGADSQLLAAAIGSKTGDAKYTPTADFNQDGVIDANDSQLAAKDFGWPLLLLLRLRPETRRRT